MHHMLTAIAELLAIGAVITLLGKALIARAHPPRGRFVDVGGLRQHLRGSKPARAHAAQDTPLVLIHGAGCNLEDMRLALGERLAGRRLILIDRPGHGWSERRGADGSSPPIRRQWCVTCWTGSALHVRLSSAIPGVERWRYGFALDHPQCVAGLVLLAPPLYPFSRGMTWFYDIMATPFSAGSSRRRCCCRSAHCSSASDSAARFCRKGRRDIISSAPARYCLAAPEHFSRTRATLRICRKICRRKPRVMTTLAVPTVIITGDRDLIVAPRRHAMAFAEAVPAAKLVVLPGIGHMLHHAAAERVAAEIESWR